jgi:hypothetical protein
MIGDTQPLKEFVIRNFRFGTGGQSKKEQK